MTGDFRERAFVAALMAAACSGALLSAPARAQDTPAVTTEAGTSDKLGDIVVTAQRRSENLQKVPVTVSVVGAATVANYGIQTSQQLQTAVPGLIINKAQMNAAPFLRGIGINSGALGFEMPVALYLDGVYLPAAPANVFNLSSIDRVEVLKGPQGTLFGRNATGGVISIVTRDPGDRTRGDFDLSYGNYRTWTGNAYVGGALSDTLAADFVYAGGRQGDGFGRNITNGYKNAREQYSDAGRAKIKWKIDSATDLTLTGQYSRQKSSIVGFTPVAGASDFLHAIPAPSGFYDSYGSPQFAESHGYAVSGKLSHDFGWATLSDIAAYQAVREFEQLDFDAFDTAAPDTTSISREKVFTNELQLSSPSNQTVNWVAGLFYMDFTNPNYITTANYVSIPIIDRSYLTTRSLAPYAQVTVAVTPTTRLTAGLRYTHDSLRISGGEERATIVGHDLQGIGVFNYNSDQRSKQGRLTWRAAVEQDLTPDIMAYLSYNRGFRAGIFNAGTPNLPVTKPEILDSYEGGLKTTLFDRRVNLNVSVFHYEYSGIILRSYDTTLKRTFLTNAAHARETGGDIDLRARLEGFDVNAGVEIIDAHYNDFPNAVLSTRLPDGTTTSTIGSASGNHMVQVPKVSLQFGVSRSITVGDSQFTASANLKHTSKTYFDPDNRFTMGSVDLVSGTVKWSMPGKPWEVSLFGTNLLNEKYWQGYSSSGSDYIVVAAPRQYGVRVGLHF